MTNGSPARRIGPGRSTRPWLRWLNTTVAGTAPPVAAFVAQVLLEPSMARWSLFYPAVFVSSWLGGFASGFIATALSSILILQFIPLKRTFIVPYVIFLLMGIAMSVMQGRLRRLNHKTTRALHASRRAGRRLKRVLAQRRLFAALIENSTDFIGIADPSGKPLYLNPAGRRMVGLAPDADIKATRIPEYYPPELRSRVIGVIARQATATGFWQGEMRFRHWRTGKDIPVWQNQFMITDPRTKRPLGYGTITRDISMMKRDRDRLQQANRDLAARTNELSENQRLLQAIVDNSPNIIIVKDLGGRYLLVNRQLAEMLHTSSAHATGKTDTELFPQTIAEHHRTTDAAAIEKHGPITYEETIELDGSPRAFQANKFPLYDGQHQPFGVCAIWSDITERKRTEEELRRREADLSAAERLSHIGSWTWYSHDDSATWSDELYRIFGREPGGPLPRLFSDDAHLFTPESVTALRDAVRALLHHGRPYEMELELVRPDGSKRIVAARGDAMHDASGAIIGTRGTAQDITERKALERMRDEWTSVIAHDLRQPIGVILMAASALPELHEGPMNDKETLFATRIVSAAQGLSRMVNDLLDLSLLEARRLKLDCKWVNPRALVRETIEGLVHVTADRRVALVGAADVPKLFVDPMRLGQVIGNLITNAVKYGEEHTDIVVRVERTDDEVEIAVTNSGRGIKPEELPRLFGRFTRSTSARGSGVPGLGVGLYIAKELVEAHGGRIWAESTPGQTTTFHVRLPTSGANRQVA